MTNWELISLSVTIGAVALAVVVTLLFLRASAGRRASLSRWKRRANELDQNLSNMESIFAAYPGLVLVWNGKIPDPKQDWGEPAVYGSTAALASLVRFAEPGKPKEFARNLLEGLADHHTIDSSGGSHTLRQLVDKLRLNGEAFSASIALPGNKLIEADGNVAGAQIVLWLEDASIRAGDEKAAISKFENEKLAALSDPVAFVEIMGKAPFPIWRQSGSGRIAWVNNAYIQAVGEADLGQVLEEQVYLDDLCADQAKQALSQNTNVKDVRPLILEGKVMSSLISMFPVSGGVAGMAVDASEAENLRAALKRHIRAHDETLNKMGEAVAIFGADKQMNFHNHAFAKMFGLTENWFSEHPTHAEWLDYLRDKRRLPEMPNYAEWQNHELSYYTDWPDEVPDDLWSLPDGRELRLVRMRDPEGGISLLFGDITDQMTMQSQLGTQINVQTATLDKLTEGVAVFGPDGRLKIYNASFQDMWHLPDQALVDQPRFRDLTNLFINFYHDREFWKDMQARTTDPSPEVRRHVNGEINRTDDTILTYLSKPLPDGATLVVWEDVSAARGTEAALRKSAEAIETAARLKSEFVGLISYQLRTPLTTISGYGELMQSGAAGELSDKQSEYLFAVQSAANDLSQTIDDILDFSAIEADTIDLNLGDVNIKEVLEFALEEVGQKAEENNIELVLSCPDNIGVIRADEKRINQIVYNLLSNALRFTKPGGRIELGANSDDGLDEVSEGTHTMGSITIWVKDNGVGIPSDKQPQVFESFKSSRGGAGLGLALVDRFVNRHGGWVELDSEEGKGTQIACHLPRHAVLDGAAPELGL